MIAPHRAAARLALVLLPTLAGAGAPAAAQTDGTLGDIGARGSIRVAVAEETFLPWLGRDADGDLLGFEVDVASDVAAALDVAVEFVEVPYDELPRCLAEAQCDVVVSAYSITAARARSVRFSDPYGSTDYFLVVDMDALPPDAIDGEYDVSEMSVGVTGGSPAATFAAGVFSNARIVRFGDDNAVRDALRDGEVDGAILPDPYPNFLLAQDPEKYGIGSDPLFGTVEGFAVAPGADDLLSVLNAWVAENTANGRLGAARAYWFSSLDWMGRLDGGADGTDDGSAPKPIVARSDGPAPGPAEAAPEAPAAE
ncbi:substrate-binding periplasmic protein [Acuticoccus sediminis]|uniref:substrate-binding periplasmic protein n=1 Tax=Acuticoccus sediminis TaxID=2184697 RepID=UPI001CFED298|nr:ABC transporter substrate-binding protein [Acuticoccus sediminis]